MGCVPKTPTGSTGVELTGNGYEDICLAVVLSGIYEDDLEFLESDWCSALLDLLHVGIEGLELYQLYHSEGGLGYGRKKTQRSRQGTRLV